MVVMTPKKMKAPNCEVSMKSDVDMATANCGL